MKTFGGQAATNQSLRIFGCWSIQTQWSQLGLSRVLDCPLMRINYTRGNSDTAYSSFQLCHDVGMGRVGRRECQREQLICSSDMAEVVSSVTYLPTQIEQVKLVKHLNVLEVEVHVLIPCQLAASLSYQFLVHSNISKNGGNVRQSLASQWKTK